MRTVRPLDTPVCLRGAVVKGFGRGSKELGIPTANLPQEALEQLPAQFDAGIYFGWASIDGAGPYKMVASVGWNPFYDNKTRTVEPHLLHEFAHDFYGAEIRLVMTGYLRPEANFNSLEALIEAINLDIGTSRDALEAPCHARLSTHEHLKLKDGGGPKALKATAAAACLAAFIFLLLRKRLAR